MWWHLYELGGGKNGKKVFCSCKESFASVHERGLSVLGDYASTVTLLTLKPIQKIDRDLWFDAIDIVK